MRFMNRHVPVLLAALAAPVIAEGLEGDQPGPQAPAETTLPPSSVPGPVQRPGAPLPPSEAARRMTLPEGFTATLFAAEPDVRQPIAFTIDPRGRLWVAECYSYPAWKGGPLGRDRILIFEDTDGDGRADRRTVFWDKGSNLTGVALGFGGVWVCATPNLLFIPDRDGDDVPDGTPEVVLDGWDVKAQHNMFNALTWGPDGWLWGCNGIMSNSRVGRPGTPDAHRVAINCGVWRYHPTRQVFEVVAHGTTNPWGLDFDDHGEAFITNCVIPHLYRVVPGARFQRMYGQDFNPHAYGLMESCADHIHWAGGHWQDSREGRGQHGEAGGGHAHVGAMIYLGDNWPDRYRDSLLTCNLHGHRVNNDRLERRGSGTVATHGPDFLLANDTWFRGMELKYGPDGAVFLTDWSDIGECHETDADGAHRENGRIYKIAYGPARPVAVDLARLDDAELVRLQRHKNDWHVRTARRLLQERTAAGRDMDRVHRALWDLFRSDTAVTRKLRAVWALHVTDGLDEAALLAMLDHESEHVRSWAIRLLGDRGEPPSAAEAKFAALARDDPSPLVRLYLASALQRLALERRRAIAEGLVAHADDARDRDLPLMTWYGIEPLVSTDLRRAAALTVDCRIPLVRRFLARRIVSADAVAGPAALVERLGQGDDPASQRDMLAGLFDALRGRKVVTMPAAWPSAFERLAHGPDPEVRQSSLLLSLLFGGDRAVALLQEAVTTPSEEAEWRRSALQVLVERRPPRLAPWLQALLDDPALRGPALRALAAYADPATPQVILGRYGALSEAERDDAVTTLASRPAYALALLDAVAAGTVPRRDLNATTARQLQSLGDRCISERLEEVWGLIRPTSGEKAAQMARYKALLTPEALKDADPARGRRVFNRTCLQCHRLYDAGGDVGPDLTGSDRANLDYVLENVLDPSAVVGRDYTLTSVATTDGRLISGLIREQSETSLVIQTVNEWIVLPREDVEEMKSSSVSMMPEGLLEELTVEEVRDLVAYLASTAQVPLPEGSSRE